MKTVLISAAIVSMFFTFSAIDGAPVENYTKRVEVSNADYCKAWKAGEPVIGATKNEMDKLCDSI